MLTCCRKLNETLSFCSTENFSSDQIAKTHKYIYYEPYNILQLTKAMLSYKYDHKDDMYKLGEPRDYQKLDITNSSKKYSTVVQPVIFQPKESLQKRQTISVFATKGKLINGELVESVFIYKTCNTD